MFIYLLPLQPWQNFLVLTNISGKIWLPQEFLKFWDRSCYWDKYSGVSDDILTDKERWRTLLAKKKKVWSSSIFEDRIYYTGHVTAEAMASNKDFVGAVNKLLASGQYKSLLAIIKGFRNGAV